MSWNFDDDSVRVPRSVLRAVVIAEKTAEDDGMEWPRVRLVLMRALGEFPAARDAVLKAIHELFAERNDPAPLWAT